MCDTSPTSVAVVTSVHNDVGFAIISNLLKVDGFSIVSSVH
ncbi:hypothetical protein [Lactobacillus amylovorus]